MAGWKITTLLPSFTYICAWSEVAKLHLCWHSSTKHCQCWIFKATVNAPHKSAPLHLLTQYSCIMYCNHSGTQSVQKCSFPEKRVEINLEFLTISLYQKGKFSLRVNIYLQIHKFGGVSKLPNFSFTVAQVRILPMSKH